MRLSFRHDKLCSPVDAVVRAVPIDNHAVDSPADHVRDLIVDLRRICGTVANADVARPTKPQKQMSVNLGGRARIQQGMYVHFADVAGAQIAIGLADKIVGGAGVVRRLRSQGCGWHNVVVQPRTHLLRTAAELQHRTLYDTSFLRSGGTEVLRNAFG